MDRSEIAARVAKTRAAGGLLRSRMSLCIFSLARPAAASGRASEPSWSGRETPPVEGPRVVATDVGSPIDVLRSAAETSASPVASRGETTKESFQPLGFSWARCYCCVIESELAALAQRSNWGVIFAELKGSVAGRRGNRAVWPFLRSSGKIRNAVPILAHDGPV